MRTSADALRIMMDGGVVISDGRRFRINGMRLEADDGMGWETSRIDISEWMWMMFEVEYRPEDVILFVEAGI